MKAHVRQLIQAAKAQAEHRDRKPMTQAAPVSACVSPAVIDPMMSEARWSTFTEIAERFRLKWDKVARDFKGRDGVVKFGSDYRVAEFAVRRWLIPKDSQGRWKSRRHDQ
jgi:hypothetical protein